MATSVLLRERHMINRAKSARLLGQTSRQSSRNGKVGCTATVSSLDMPTRGVPLTSSPMPCSLVRQVLPFARTFVGPRKSVSADAQHTSSEVRRTRKKLTRQRPARSQTSQAVDYVAKHSVLCACFLVLRGGAQITAFERRNHVEQDLKLCTKGVRPLR